MVKNVAIDEELHYKIREHVLKEQLKDNEASIRQFVNDAIQEKLKEVRK